MQLIWGVQQISLRTVCFCPVPTCQWPACMFDGVKSSQLWGSRRAPVGTCAFPLPGELVYLKGKSLVLVGAGGGDCTEIVL